MKACGCDSLKTAHSILICQTWEMKAHKNLEIFCMCDLYVSLQATFHDGQVTLLVMSYLIDAMMYVDIYTKFRTTFVNPQGQTIQSYYVIHRKYLCSKDGFVIDCVAALPVEIFALFFPWNIMMLVLLYMRCWHILRIIRLTQYFLKWEKELNINVLFVRSCKFAALFALITHTLGCVWYMIACPFASCREGSWIQFNSKFSFNSFVIVTCRFLFSLKLHIFYNLAQPWWFSEFLGRFLLIGFTQLYGQC